MSGGMFEYVMGNYNNAPGNSGLSQLWLDSSDNKKYFDSYNNANLKKLLTESTVGSATAETKRWYNDDMIDLVSPNDGNWLVRGSFSENASATLKEDGIFSYIWKGENGSGNSFTSFRTVLVNN